MVKKAIFHQLIFRPHFKTHRSAFIANWFKEYGVDKCTVSNVEMAEYFFNNGWKDITIAFPVNILEIEKINALALKTNLNLLLDNSFTISALDKKLNAKAGIFVKIDTGYHRTGVDVTNYTEIERLVYQIKQSDNLNFKGFLTHNGSTYNAKNKEEIIQIHEQSLNKLISLKSNLNISSDYIISIGDTPSCSIASNFTGIDEIRPGNFIFYDSMQFAIGSCRFEQIAVCVACPVVSKYPQRNEIVVYGGAVHLSKESCIINNRNCFGLVAEIINNEWILIEDAYVKSLSQEHGIIHLPDFALSKKEPGSIIGIIPVHSCLTVGVMQKYHVTQTNEIISTHHDNY